MTTLIERPASVGDVVRWDEDGGPAVGTVLAADDGGCLVKTSGDPERSKQRLLTWDRVRTSRPGPEDVWPDGGHLPCPASEVLTDRERTEFLDAEKTIRQGRQTFLDVGLALRRIQEGRLYRETHRNFETYLYEKWGLNRTHAYQLMTNAETAARVSGITDIPLRVETHAQALAKAPADEQPAIWQEAVETAPAGRVTAAHIEQVVQRALAGVGEEPVPDPPALQHTPRFPPAGTAIRKASDHYQTPPPALEPLLPFIPAHWIVWEPAAGQGNIVRVLETHGCGVIETDLLKGVNFLGWEPEGHWDGIVTNPPYSLKDEFLARCYVLGKPFALLMPGSVIADGKARQDLYRRHGVQVLLLPDRVKFTLPSGEVGDSPYRASCWVTWGLNLPSDLCLPAVAEPPALERTCCDCGAKVPVDACGEWKRLAAGWQCPACIAQRSAAEERWQVYVDRITAVNDALYDEASAAFEDRADGTPLLEQVEALLGLEDEAAPEPTELLGKPLQLAVGDLVEWTEPFGDLGEVTWAGKVVNTGAALLRIHSFRPCIKCVEVDDPAELPGLRRVE